MGTIRGKTALDANLVIRGAHADEHGFSSVITDLIASTEVERLSVTVGTETANVIPVTLQLKEGDGTTNKAAARTIQCRVYDSNLEIAAAAAFTLAETGDGTEITTTAQPSIEITLSAAGAAEISITDVVGASAATVYLVCEGFGAFVIPESDSATFD